MRNTCEVRITPHPKKPDWYVATYRSGFLGASYSVEFANSITGAVALYHNWYHNPNYPRLPAIRPTPTIPPLMVAFTGMQNGSDN